MSLLIAATVTAILIALFTLLRIPLNRWTVPATSLLGIVFVFGLIQVLNYYHPYSSGSSRQYQAQSASLSASGEVFAPAAGYEMLAFFHPGSLLRIDTDSRADVTFDGVPGRVFSARVKQVLPLPADARNAARPRIPVLIEISDARYFDYAARIPGGSPARAAVYGSELEQLGLLRKTLLHMSAWMNYLTPLS